MKKITIVLCAVIILLSFNSCSSDEPESVTEALKISTWLLDKNFEGTGYWAFDDGIVGGNWISYDSDVKIDHKKVFKLEQLALNEVRIIAPLNYNNMPNLNLLFDFDGILEIEPENPEAQTIQLSYNDDFSIEPAFNFSISTWGSVSMIGPVNINVCPIGKFTEQTGNIRGDTLVGEEYYINVKAYKHDGTLYITAKLKLTAIEDKEYPQDEFSFLEKGDEKSRFLSIEVVSYEYSDIYKFENVK